MHDALGWGLGGALRNGDYGVWSVGGHQERVPDLRQLGDDSRVSQLRLHCCKDSQSAQRRDTCIRHNQSLLTGVASTLSDINALQDMGCFECLPVKRCHDPPYSNIEMHSVGHTLHVLAGQVRSNVGAVDRLCTDVLFCYGAHRSARCI